jgi:hypothetical protein
MTRPAPVRLLQVPATAFDLVNDLHDRPAQLDSDKVIVRAAGFQPMQMNPDKYSTNDVETRRGQEADE